MKKNENKELSLRAEGVASKKQRLSSLVRRKSERQAIFKFVLPLASKGIEGIKYIFTFLRIRRSLEFFAFAKNRDDSLLFLASPWTRFSEIATSAFRLLAMTFATLFLILPTESWADVICAENQKSCGKACISSDAVCYTCGTNCHAYYTGEGYNKTLNITGTGKMDDYKDERDSNNVYHSKDTPWKDDTFKKVVIESGITSIGEAAFTGFGITSADIPDTVTNIGKVAFMNNNLTSVDIPDTVTFIGQSAFHTNQLTSVVLPDSLTKIIAYAFFMNPLSSVTIPDSVTSIGSTILGNNLAFLDNLEIICKGDSQSCAYIKDYMENYTYGDYSEKVHVASNYSQCDSKMYYWDGAVCKREADLTKRKCCSSCKDMGGWCNRVRYTPAEAAEYLKDTDNTIIMTFKVNR